MRRTTIGISVGVSALRAVGVRGGRVRWAVEADATPEESISAALVALLERAPIQRWPRPIAVAGVGASRAQTKRLTGLPPLTDPRALAQLVREGASRFFLRNGTPLLTSGVRLVEPGTVWASALEQPLLLELERACRTAKVLLRAVVPDAVVLGAALEPQDGSIVWPDGDVASVLTFEQARLAAVRRVPRDRSRGGSAMATGAAAVHGDGDGDDASDASECAPPHPVAPLATLGTEAWRFAAAYGATLLPRSEPLALRPGLHTLRAPGVPRWRRAVAISTCLASLTAAALAPGLAATRAARTASKRLATLGASRHEVVAMGSELRRVTAALEQVAAFDRTRTSATFLLGTLTAALPRGIALVTLRVDSTAGTLVALAPHAAAIVNALDRTAGIVAPEIIGPVTREAAGTRELERVTIRFRLGVETAGEHQPAAHPTHIARTGR